MEACLEPGQKTGLGARQVHIAHANLGKSQFQGPGPNSGNELTAADLHHGIVGTCPAGPELRLRWDSEDDTERFAKRLAALPGVRQAYLELQGELGAGKTTLVRHLLRALGVQGRIKSPTYAVVEPHEAGHGAERLRIWHFDFYRFNDPREWEDAGFRDLFASPGLKLAEWPDKAAGMLPAPDLVLQIRLLDDPSATEAGAPRELRVIAPTSHGQALLEGLRP